MAVFRVGITASYYDANGNFIDGGMDLSALENESGLEIVRIRKTPVLEPSDIRELDALFIREVELYKNCSVHPNHRLTHLARFGVGYDNINVDVCNAHGVVLTTTPDASRRPMAVATLTFLLALASRLKEKETCARMGAPGFPLGPQVTGVGFVGRTLGIVGLGNIGREVVRLAKVFDLKFIAHDPYVGDDVFDELGVVRADLQTLFRESDFVSLNCALTDETRYMIDMDLLSLMKPTAYFINVSRGPVVRQADIVKVLQEERIAGAALDVFDPEPLTADDPILKLPPDRVILTPHAIGFTDQLVPGSCAMVISSILAVKRGQVPKGIVNNEIVGNADWNAKLNQYGSGQYQN
jgi:phosphoglycerate dehydrogenase-like enzyme